MDAVGGPTGTPQSAGQGQIFQRIGVVTEEIQQAVAHAKRQQQMFHECREVREELGYGQENHEQMAALLHTALHGEGPEHRGKFTPSQQRAFEAIIGAVEGRNVHKQVYIDARGLKCLKFLERLSKVCRYLFTKHKEICAPHERLLCLSNLAPG